ncbi:MAG: sulfatase-like hydrolase/transferase [Planctomycetaceae bacterium]|nr:sulfatase-like hydrolase/transferase [Planctomycetaceae bacterium]
MNIRTPSPPVRFRTIGRRFHANLRHPITAVFFIAAFACPAANSLSASASEKTTARPNIIVILADDLGYGECGCQGNDQIPTPHIDSIAASGTRFTDGYVTAPFCSASRAGLLTGRYQNRFGYEFNPIGADNEDPAAGLPIGEQTLADLLHSAGYATALVGKWHLGGTARYHPHRRGFDEFFGFLHEGHYFTTPPYAGVTTMLRRRVLPSGGSGRWVSRSGRLILSTHMGHDEPAYDADNPLYRSGQPVEEHLYLTDAFTREATDFIRRTNDRPFFLYLAYNAVHSPLQGADAYMERFAGIEDVHRRIFAAMLSNLDEGVGSVLRTLQEEHLDESTLIFFLSDNGGPTRELTSSNLPLRGEKGSLYEGGIRVPFLVRWPGVIPKAGVYDRPVISLDILPTALAAAGIRPARDAGVDGVDLLPFLRRENDADPHPTLFWRTGNRAALRHHDLKIVRSGSAGDHAWQLFDLKTDLGESTDLAGKMPDKLQNLRSVWETMNAEMSEPIWTPQRR